MVDYRLVYKGWLIAGVIVLILIIVFYIVLLALKGNRYLNDPFEANINGKILKLYGLPKKIKPNKLFVRCGTTQCLNRDKVHLLLVDNKEDPTYYVNLQDEGYNDVPVVYNLPGIGYGKGKVYSGIYPPQWGLKLHDSNDKFIAEFN